MELYAEMKLMGDGYAGGFTNGMTMTHSETIEGFTQSDVIQEKEGQGKVYKNKEGLVLKVHEEKDGEAVRVWTEFRNESDRDVTVEMIASFALKGIEADKIHRLQSFWSAEGKLRTETIEDLHLEKSWNGCAARIEKFGNVGSMPVRKYFPFVALENSKTGKIVGVQLGMASSWQIEIACKESQNFEVTGGIADRDFGHWYRKIPVGEGFVTPPAVIAEGSSLYEVCDKLVKTQHPRISPVDDHMGIMFNEYCTSWGNPDIHSISRMSEALKGKGIQYLVIDSGWYGKPNDWAQSVGNWEVNKDRFPDGMKSAADVIRANGMVPGIWFELEVVGPNSPYFNETEHLLKKDGMPLTASGRRFWDMEDPWVIEHLTKEVIGTLKEGGFGYIKIDYNDTIGMGCDGGDSLGDGLYRKVKGTQKFFEKIREEIPGIVIENCSSGGHRLVSSMMELASQASFSDAHETTAIPLIAANMHRVIRPEQSQIWAVLRAGDSIERLTYSLVATFLGRMCLSGDIYDLSEEQWKLVMEGMNFYKKAAEIIKNGHTVLQEYTTKSYNAPQGSQLVLRELGKKGLAVFHRFENSENMDHSRLEGKKILEIFGNAYQDFTAEAWIYENE